MRAFEDDLRPLEDGGTPVSWFPQDRHVRVQVLLRADPAGTATPDVLVRDGNRFGRVAKAGVATTTAVLLSAVPCNDEDDDPESLAGDEVDFDLAAALEEEE